MRFTLIRGSPLGTDVQLNPEDVEEAFRPGRNFANKVWNAARFALPQLDEEDLLDGDEPSSELADRWIRSRFAATTRAVTEALEAFRLHEAAEAIHGFVWGEFCDWYLELVKGRLAGARGGVSRREAARTVGLVMDGWLRLLHPIMPFITEEIARKLPGPPDGFTLVTGPWPQARAGWDDTEAEEAMASFQELVGTVRALRSEYRVDPGAKLEVRLRSGSGALDAALEAEREGALRLAGLAAITAPGDGAAQEPGAHAVLRSGSELFIPLSGVIDLERERARLLGEDERIAAYLERTRAKLENAGFVANAPDEVVEREKEKERSLSEQLQRLRDKLRTLGSGA